MRNSSFRTAAVVATVIGALGLLAVPEVDVLAWTHTGVSHSSSTATYYVNPNFTDAPAGPPASQVEAIRSGADEWRLTGQGSFGFTYGGETATSTVAPDGTNTVFYNPIDGGGALAVCWYWFMGSTITNFDIEFYDRDGGSDYVWALAPTWQQFDIQGVATHEFGHALGMGHSAVGAATMYPSVAPGSTAVRSLATDDIAGYQALYGYVGPATPQVTLVTPDTGWIDGGYPVTIEGAYFPATGLTVSFAGTAATGVTRLSSTRLTCVVPQGQVPGKGAVSVTAEGQTGTLPDGFEYLGLRLVGSPARGVPMPFELRVPAAPGTFVQCCLSLGTAGIPVSSFGDPGDPRVIPVSVDWLLEFSIEGAGGLIQDVQGFTDGTGTHTFQVTVPDQPELAGLTFYACFVTGDTGGSPSGISAIGNALQVTVP